MPAIAAIADVDIGDSFANRAATNFGQNSAITTTSTISGVTYREFLASSETNPVLIGKTIVISTTAGQLEQPVTITHRNPAGKREDFVISLTIDPNQAQTDRIIDDTEYLWDGMTRFRINQVASGATVTIKLYPKTVFSATRILGGKSENINYSDPHIIKTAMLSVK